MSNVIKEMTWTEFEERSANCKTVVIPTGSIEGYGPHMPLGSDFIVAEEMAKLLADELNIMIGPSLEIGDASSLSHFPGTFVIPREVFAGYLEGVMNCLVQYEFKNILVICGHGGNVDMITYLCKKFQQRHGIKCAQIDWWRFTSANSENLLDYSGYMAHGHASECSTSVMLYLRPDLVQIKRIEDHEPNPELMAYYNDVLCHTSFEKKAPRGVLGIASAATREKGELIINTCKNRIIEFMKAEFDL